MVHLFIAGTFLLMYHQEVSTYISFDYFKRVLVEEKTEIAWSVGNVSSKLKCTSLCLADVRCYTFGFVEATGTCQAFGPGMRRATGKHGFTVYTKGRSGDMQQTCVKANNCYMKGSLCYRGRCICGPEFSYNKSQQACVRKPGGMRQPCVDDNDCFINGSLCYKGRCMCTPGLSYHKAGQACVRRCRVYGKSMSFYEELCTKGHNDIESPSTPNEKCIRMCIAEKSFLCLSVDMFSVFVTNCYLSSSGYLDVNESDRESRKVGWLFGTRDCEYD